MTLLCLEECELYNFGICTSLPINIEFHDGVNSVRGSIYLLYILKAFHLPAVASKFGFQTARPVHRTKSIVKLFGSILLLVGDSFGRTYTLPV